MSWTFTGLAIILSIGRFIIRKRTLGKLLLDDWTHAFALTMLITYMGLYTTLFPLTVIVGLFGAKEAPMPSKEILERFFRLQFSFQCFFWLVLYAIKFTFLILYRHIFGINKAFVSWWWAVFVYTWLAFWGCFLEALWLCGSPSDLFVLSEYSESAL